MFWPSFNAGAAAEGDAQMRAIVNTYYRWGRHRKTKSEKDKQRQKKVEKDRNAPFFSSAFAHAPSPPLPSQRYSAHKRSIICLNLYLSFITKLFADL